MPTSYTANSKSAAIAKAILGTCRPCCGSGSGGGGPTGCTQCNECGWFNGTVAPTSFNLLAHSPSGGFADFSLTLSYLAPNTPGWNIYRGINLADVPYYGVCYPDWDGDGLGLDYYAVGVWRGSITDTWSFPGVDVSARDCESGLTASISGTDIKLNVDAMLVNYVYLVGSTYCYSWLLAVVFTDYRSPPTLKSAGINGVSVVSFDCDSAQTPKAANMLVDCDGSPYYFYANGTINCREDNSDCDGSFEYGVTLYETLVGHTYELTVT